MDRNVSIVLTPGTANYRKVAQKHWGLTDEQMKGMHVHHRIKRCEGGTNDPSNLYVCSEWYHDNVWHAEEGGFTGCASRGGRNAHRVKNEEGKSVLASSNMKKAHSDKNVDGKSLLALRVCEKNHREKTSDGKSVLAKKMSEASAEKTRVWVELVDAQGKVYVFKGLRYACQTLGLDVGTVYKICSGKRKSHKGFTARYIENPEPGLQN
jgi:hypothetical protein